MELWTKKYQPKASSEVIGQAQAVAKISSFVNNYKKGALILHGPTGTGKSCSVYCVAKDLDCEVLEINSSDVRNKDAISRVVGSSSSQASLFSRKKLILIDEVDGISGTHDRGGIAELASIIGSSKWPIILTSNDAYSEKLKPLRKTAAPVEFLPIDANDIFSRLKHVCEMENVSYSEDVLKSLAWQSGGDLRSALNDLQNISIIGSNVTSLESLGGRMQRGKIDDALRLIFKSTNAGDVLDKFDDVDMDLDDCILWLDENLPYEYSGYDLMNGYECLSRADVFRGRIRKWQHWRFLVYVSALATAGMAVSKSKRSPKVVDYRRSLRILLLWQAKVRNAKRWSVSEKVAAKAHCSSRRAFQDMVPYLRVAFRNADCSVVAKELGLNEEEVEWLRG